MSNDAGDAASRLSDAIDEILSGSRSDDASAPADEPTDEPYELPADEPADEPYELPPIVSATEHEGWLDEHPSTTAPVPAAAATPPVTPTRPAAPAPTPAAPTRPAAPAPTPAAWTRPAPAAVTPAGAQLRAPGRRARVRRVTRVLRHIDPWSTFKVALVFSLVAYVVTLTSGVLLWRVADGTGTLDNVERWFTQFGWETFEFDGGEIFHNAWIIGLFGVVVTTGAAVLLVTLFNLVSDIVGGIRLTVLEEEVVERTVSSTRRYVVRPGVSSEAIEPAAPPVAEGESPAADWSVD